MPYIDYKGRQKFLLITSSLDGLLIENQKELAYLIRLFINVFVGYYRDSHVVTNDTGKFVYIEKLIHEIRIDNNGELNYLITKTIKSYIDHHGEKYQHYDDVINAIDRVYSDIDRYDTFIMPCGTLSCVKQELFRRKINPYEDIKIAENGDVW